MGQKCRIWTKLSKIGHYRKNWTIRTKLDKVDKIGPYGQKIGKYGQNWPMWTRIGQNGQELDKKWTIRIKVDKMDEMDKIGL